MCATHCQWLFGSCTTNFLSKWRFWTVKWPNIPLKPTWHLLNINLTKSIKGKKWFACGRWTFKFLNIQNISNIFLGKLVIISVKNYFFKNAYHRHLRDNWHDDIQMSSRILVSTLKLLSNILRFYKDRTRQNKISKHKKIFQKIKKSWDKKIKTKKIINNNNF